MRVILNQPFYCFLCLLVLWSGCKKEEKATVKTLSITEVTTTSAKGGGNVTDDGGSAVVARGVVWHTDPAPTIENNLGKTVDGSGVGLFSSSMIQLTPNTSYNVRAYATNSTGTSYGEVVTFKSSISSGPVIVTDPVTNITQTTATGGGAIISDGGSAITARGVCLSTSPNPTVADIKTVDGNGTGSFTSNLTGLQPGTTYYVRAYAVNSAGTAYGGQQTFATQTVGATIPTVTTTAVTNVTQTGATGGGNVTSDGGAPVTARGVCWSTNQNPTVGVGNHTSDGSGTGAFTSNISGLQSSSNYYVRAYATNSEGTGYGDQVTLSTAGCPPTVTDFNGNVYNTVQIGNQCWMKENLVVRNYNDGTPIPNVTSGSNWTIITYGARCWYMMDSATYAGTYGSLYNWFAANSGNLCPVGWKVPSDDDWKTLEIALGMTTTEANKTGWRGTNEGGKLKEADTTHWIHPNTGATNSSGFTALPGGHIYANAYHYNLGSQGYWWTSTSKSSSNAYFRCLVHDFEAVCRSDYKKQYGHSVRCVRE